MADEKTILFSDVKLYRATVLLSESCVSGVVHVSPVPVLNDEDHLLGWASVDFMGRYATANLVLSYATPERLDLETGARKLYAHTRFDPAVTYRPIISAIVLQPFEFYRGQPAVGEPLL